MEQQDEILTGEIINDTDGGNQVTNVTVNVIVPMFCWFNPFMFPFGMFVPRGKQ